MGKPRPRGNPMAFLQQMGAGDNQRAWPGKDPQAQGQFDQIAREFAGNIQRIIDEFDTFTERQNMSVKARNHALETAKDLYFQGSNTRTVVTGALDAYESMLDTIDPNPTPDPDPKPKPTPNPANDFQTYSLLRYKNTPNLRQFGIHTPKIWYESAFDKSGLMDSMPPVSVIADLAKKAGMLSILDLENAMKANNWQATPEVVGLYVDVMTEYKKHLQPGAKVGFYGEAPTRNYWAAIDPDGPKMANWARENDKRKPLAAAADILFPSLYTLTVNPDNMYRYMTSNLDEALRMLDGADKPIVPFLWPQVHSSAVDEDYRNKPVPGPLFRRQMEICKDWGCDGVVLWHLSATKAVDFKDAGDWWSEVVEFQVVNGLVPA